MGQVCVALQRQRQLRRRMIGAHRDDKKIRPDAFLPKLRSALAGGDAQLNVSGPVQFGGVARKILDEQRDARRLSPYSRAQPGQQTADQKIGYSNVEVAVRGRRIEFELLRQAMLQFV